ncbi:peroxiredoxin [Pseudomonas corrugata]
MTNYRTETELRKSLIGIHAPTTPFVSTNGSVVNLSDLTGLTVLFIYPRTGNPNVPAPVALDSVPGAKGCTPQACGFRDAFEDLHALGVDHVFGLSAQDTDYQLELKERLQLPYDLLSDEACRLASQLGLPTFQVDTLMLYSRAALIINDGLIVQVFTDIPTPGENAADIAAWLKFRVI